MAFGNLSWLALFKEKTEWEEHGTAIVGIVLFVLFQSLVDTGLSIERRRAESKARHLFWNLFTSINRPPPGHYRRPSLTSFNQPLGANQMNAATAELLIDAVQKANAGMWIRRKMRKRDSSSRRNSLHLSTIPIACSLDKTNELARFS